jgi:hypothetical protein
LPVQLLITHICSYKQKFLKSEFCWTHPKLLSTELDRTYRKPVVDVRFELILFLSQKEARLYNIFLSYHVKRFI